MKSGTNSVPSALRGPYNAAKKVFFAACVKFPALRRVRFARWELVRRKYERIAANAQTDPKTVVFECFGGRQFTCSPRAIYLAMLQDPRFEGWTLTWSFCADAMPLMENEPLLNAAHVVERGSDAYYTALANSKYWIFNNRVAEYVTPRPDQVYVQCWHGTPLKRLGYDVPESTTGGALNSASELAARFGMDVKKWSYLLSPSAFTSQHLADAFGLPQERRASVVLEEGYPRNDFIRQMLDAPDAQQRVERIKDSISTFLVHEALVSDAESGLLPDANAATPDQASAPGAGQGGVAVADGVESETHPDPVASAEEALGSNASLQDAVQGEGATGEPDELGVRPDSAGSADALSDETIEQYVRRFGIPADKKVLLYAPTFRDDQFTPGVGYSLQLPLDLDALQAAVGDDWVVLLRMHYYIANKLDLSKWEGFAFNVSAWPDINELYVVADALCTDYSSVFFDYANTRRPIYFLWTDYEHYSDALRGFYIDPMTLPGPKCRNNAEFVEAFAHNDAWMDEYGDAYTAFCQEYCPHDDGHAAQRVIDRIFEL